VAAVTVAPRLAELHRQRKATYDVPRSRRFAVHADSGAGSMAAAALELEPYDPRDYDDEEATSPYWDVCHLPSPMWESGYFRVHSDNQLVRPGRTCPIA